MVKSDFSLFSYLHLPRYKMFEFQEKNIVKNKNGDYEELDDQKKQV